MCRHNEDKSRREILPLGLRCNQQQQSADGEQQAKAPPESFAGQNAKNDKSKDNRKPCGKPQIIPFPPLAAWRLPLKLETASYTAYLQSGWTVNKVASGSPTEQARYKSAFRVRRPNLLKFYAMAVWTRFVLRIKQMPAFTGRSVIRITKSTLRTVLHFSYPIEKNVRSPLRRNMRNFWYFQPRPLLPSQVPGTLPPLSSSQNLYASSPRTSRYNDRENDYEDP